MPSARTNAESFFAGHPLALAVFRRVYDVARDNGPVGLRVSRSQVALRRRRGFAYLWLPGQYLHHPDAEVVLSIALGREVPSPRFKATAHPSPSQWMHHLEVQDTRDIDDEVTAWLKEAAERAT